MNTIQTETPDPAKPRRLSVRIECSGGVLRLRCRSPKWAGGIFMALWLTGWTVGCVFLAGKVTQQPELFYIVFAVPFWASWFFVSFTMLKWFFQLDELLLDQDGATFMRSVLVPLKARRVPLREIRSFGRYTGGTESETGIEMRTLGLPIRMAEGLADAELRWLQSELNRHLRALRAASRTRESHRRNTTLASATPAVSDRKHGASTTLSVAGDLISPPSDCRWARFIGFDDFGFARRGRFGAENMLALAFLNAFWNGAVSVFVLILCGAAPINNPPAGAAWWELLVFLIPFEVIGLLMLIALLAALLEPVHRTVWTISRRSIERRSTWLGVGPHWKWEVTSLDRIELHWDAKQAGRASNPARSLATAAAAIGGCYRLSLVDKSNTELCSIGGLTEGEARWIGDAVLRERGAWFR